LSSRLPSQGCIVVNVAVCGMGVRAEGIAVRERLAAAEAAGLQLEVSDKRSAEGRCHVNWPGAR
jgi:hypothetical protein